MESESKLIQSTLFIFQDFFLLKRMRSIEPQSLLAFFGQAGFYVNLTNIFGCRKTIYDAGLFDKNFFGNLEIAKKGEKFAILWGHCCL